MPRALRRLTASASQPPSRWSKLLQKTADLLRPYVATVKPATNYLPQGGAGKATLAFAMIVCCAVYFWFMLWLFYGRRSSQKKHKVQ